MLKIIKMKFIVITRYKFKKNDFFYEFKFCRNIA